MPERQPGLPSQDMFKRVPQPVRAPTGRSLDFNARIKLKANFYQGDACTQLVRTLRKLMMKTGKAGTRPALPKSCSWELPLAS